MQFLLLCSAFVIATCGLIYELIAGTLASYLLGDSVTQFSTIIGVYLFSMGIGAYLSRFFHKNTQWQTINRYFAAKNKVDAPLALVRPCSNNAANRKKSTRNAS